MVGGFKGVVPREGLGVGPLDRTPVTLMGVRLVRLKKRVSASSRASLVSRVPYSPSTNSSQAFLVSGCQILLWFSSGGGIVKPYRSHWGRGHLETGGYMLGTFRAHVHLSHNVTSGQR